LARTHAFFFWRDDPARHRLSSDSGHGTGLDDCKTKFKVAWSRMRAGLTGEDIAKAYEMRRR
jgi:hypothetical protein